MNTSIFILTTEILILLIALALIVRGSSFVRNLNANVVKQNSLLKNRLRTFHELLILANDYIELWKIELVKKLNNCANLLGEITVYYVVHKIFGKKYESFASGFKIAKFFW